MFGFNAEEKAYIGPFFIFLGFLLLSEMVGKPFAGRDVPWFLGEPRYWVFPLQTVVCGALLWRWWSFYPLSRSTWSPRGILIGTVIGIVALVIWIAPQQFFGVAARTDGFDPNRLGEGAAYWTNLVFRFARLVIIVPLVEEIFWRGFLLRYLINQDFTRVPIGAFSWLSFGVTTAGFMLEHGPADYPAAIITGVLFNVVAYTTRSLGACVLAHAVTNAILGVYVLRTGQWGFW